MCGRFVVARVTSADLPQPLRDRLGEYTPEALDWEPRYNLAPTQDIPVVLDSAKRDEVVVERAFWSLLPPWSESMKPKFATFNARAEKLASAPSWRGPVKAQRCIVLADGYYEWTGEKGSKQPWYIHPAEPGMLGFAGLYSWWKDPQTDAPPLLTATIVTGPARAHLERLHDRVPVTLPQSYWQRWINPEVEGSQALVDEAVAGSREVADWLTYYPVAPIRQGSDGPQLLERIEVELPADDEENPF